MRQILVVDDGLAAYQAIQDRLQNDITEVSCISSPVEALASYIQQDYCLVILDTQIKRLRKKLSQIGKITSGTSGA